MKKYILIGVLATAMVSCSDDFLKEEMVSVITQDYLATEQGLDQLIVSTYNAERVRYGYREGIYMFETGHDCTINSGVGDINKYSTSQWSATGNMATYTNEFMGFQSKQQSGFNINCFPIIDNCNKAVTAIRTGAALGKYASDPAYAAARLSEVLFNRAYMFYSMGTVLGDIPMSEISITALPSNKYYPRVPAADMYKMLISDLRYAVEKLPESYSDAEFGRITKYTAAHFLSKLYLQRAQGADYGTTAYGRNADGTIDTSNPNSYLGLLYKGKGTADLDSCVYYSSMVINSGKYKLESNYADIFDCKVADWSNEGSKEILLPGLFGNGTDNYRYGVRICCMMIGNYVNTLWGIPNYTWEYGTKPNFFILNSDRGFDVFTDKVNDSRYQGSFRLEYKTALMGGKTNSPAPDLDYYGYKDAKNTTYKWTADQATYFNSNIKPSYDRASWAGRSAVAGERKMGTGDLAVAFLENTRETAIDVEFADAQPFVLFARWMKKGSDYYYRPQIVTTSDNYSFVNSSGKSVNFYGLENSVLTGVPATTKYDDPNRNAYNDVYGTRDVPVFRFSESYLIRAEAYGRKGDFTNALKDINTVRARAAFKVGDTRAQVLATLYPGHENLSANAQKYPYTVDKASDISVTAASWDGSSDASKAEDYPATATTTLQRFVHFMCNEYAREFNQELGPYYEQVHHAGVQAERIQWYNQMGSSSSSHSASWSTAANNVVGATGQTGTNKGSFANTFTFKPFPKTQFLDLLTDENGAPLTEEAKKAYQNNGY